MATDHALHFFDRDTIPVPVLTDKDEWEVNKNGILSYELDEGFQMICWIYQFVIGNSAFQSLKMHDIDNVNIP